MGFRLEYYNLFLVDIVINICFLLWLWLWLRLRLRLPAQRLQAHR